MLIFVFMGVVLMVYGFWPVFIVIVLIAVVIKLISKTKSNGSSDL